MIPRHLLPETFCDSWFVAGGYAACPAQADDMDVWVRTDDCGMAVVDILAHLHRHYGNGMVAVEHTDITESYIADGGRLVLKVAKVSLYDFKPIHVLVTNGTIEEVLAAFDISTHQVAINYDGIVVKGNDWTPVWMPPVQLLDTPRTQSRMDKIRRRYGHMADKQLPLV